MLVHYLMIPLIVVDGNSENILELNVKILMKFLL